MKVQVNYTNKGTNYLLAWLRWIWYKKGPAHNSDV